MFIARRGPYPPGSHYVALHPLKPPASKMPTAPEMCSSHSYTTVRLASHSRYSPSLTHGALSSHGLGLRPLMFAQRHIFFRLRAFISGCLAALDAASPFPARVMPMEIGISFSCPKKNAPSQPAPHEPKDCSSYASLSQICLVNTKHLLLTEITVFGLYCPLSGQSFAAAFFLDIITPMGC